MIMVSNAIRELRESRSMTRPELARRSQMSRSYLWHLERGHMTPSLASLEKLSDALNVGMHRFFRQSHVEILLEDGFVRAVQPYLRRLNHQQRQQLMKTMEAAPRQERRGR
jgi:transcriptional regulator with XRE-family HTH domain